MKTIKTILVIDDSSTSVFLMESLLKEEGYDAIVATSGEKGLTIIAKNQPDLILLDIMMPGKSGFDVLEELQADPKTKDIPVIIISARIEHAEQEKGLALGAKSYLTKPLDFDTLFKTIKGIENL
ncbi:MAG: response regulator [Salinivirgaceae bacterium]|nr:response regulator [Salinivirgaceae bacterium]